MKRFEKKCRFLITICLVLAVAAFTACSVIPDIGGDDEAGKPETEVVRLAVFNYGHMLNAIAESQGFLEEEGIKVQ